MKTNYKILAALLLAVSIFSACKKEKGDDLKTGLDNQLEYDGVKYALKNGLAEDYGSSENHYNFDFTVVDGTFTNDDSDNSKVEVYFELLSSGTNGFKTGTFQYITQDDNDEYGDDKFRNKNFFSEGDIYIDMNGDRASQENEFLDVKAGTVTVSGSAHNYTLEFDVTLENDKKAKGKFSGAFKYSDERENSVSGLPSVSSKNTNREKILKH